MDDRAMFRSVAAADRNISSVNAAFFAHATDCTTAES
jgi:hypothetical protein